MTANAEALLALLDLEQIDETRFRGYSPQTGAKQVYGGQAVAQSLVAAQRTVGADRPVHSLHGYFVLAGDTSKPIDFAVERVRDGKSFTTRRCNATQDGHTIFSLEASFQVHEDGLEHTSEMPEATPPEALASSSAIAERFKNFLPKGARERMVFQSMLDIRVEHPERLLPTGKPGPRRQNIWFRVDSDLPDNHALHSALLAYLSDMTLLNTALAAHGRSIFDPDFQVASLDHAVWFHRPFRADDWLLYAQESPTASGARALTRGQLFTRDGRLVASVAQEGLVRPRLPKN